MTTRLHRTTGVVLTDPVDQALVVTLNRPQVLNALTHEPMDEPRALWAEVNRSPDVRRIVITGMGRGSAPGSTCPCRARPPCPSRPRATSCPSSPARWSTSR